jgi:23S rRNA (uracil1939-C5)-methyltransferase
MLEFDLDGIAHGGEALGRHAGKVVFVPYAIPGEQVRVEIVEEKERWGRARLSGLLRASPDRVEPLCPYFGPGRCGGCQWQHIAYPRQAELKREIVVDQLQRLGHLRHPSVPDVVALADPAAPDGAVQFLDFGYRSHVQFAITPEGRLGFSRAGSHDILPVERCLLLHEHLDALHGALDIAWPGMTGLTIRAGLNTGDAMIVFQTATEDEPELELDVPAACVLMTPNGPKPLIGEPWIIEEVAGRRYRVSAGSVFPENTVGAAALVELVSAYAGEIEAEVILDLYSGVGLYAVPLSELAGEVVAVESSPLACEDFEENAGSIANVSLHEGPIESVLQALREQGLRADIVVMNPPRAGAGEQALREVTATGAGRIVYVAGDPAALARAAVHLAEAGYQLREAQPVDLHPQTFRIETVAVWAKEA